MMHIRHEMCVFTVGTETSNLFLARKIYSWHEVVTYIGQEICHLQWAGNLLFIMDRKLTIYSRHEIYK